MDYRESFSCSYLACAIHVLFSESLLWSIPPAECTEVHLANPIHTLPTDSQLITMRFGH